MYLAAGGLDLVLPAAARLNPAQKKTLSLVDIALKEACSIYTASQLMQHIPGDILEHRLLPLLCAADSGRLLRTGTRLSRDIVLPRQKHLRRNVRHIAAFFRRAQRARKWRRWRRAAAQQLTRGTGCHQCGRAMEYVGGGVPEHFEMHAQIDSSTYTVHHFFCTTCWRELCRRNVMPQHPRQKWRGTEVSQCLWTCQQTQDFVYVNAASPPS